MGTPTIEQNLPETITSCLFVELKLPYNLLVPRNALNKIYYLSSQTNYYLLVCFPNLQTDVYVYFNVT